MWYKSAFSQMYFKKNNTAIAGRLSGIDIYQFVFLTSEAYLLGVT